VPSANLVHFVHIAKLSRNEPPKGFAQYFVLRPAQRGTILLEVSVKFEPEKVICI
jgi:hypothetical protein